MRPLENPRLVHVLDGNCVQGLLKRVKFSVLSVLTYTQCTGRDQAGTNYIQTTEPVTFPQGCLLMSPVPVARLGSVSTPLACLEFPNTV